MDFDVYRKVGGGTLATHLTDDECKKAIEKMLADMPDGEYNVYDADRPDFGPLRYTVNNFHVEDHP